MTAKRLISLLKECDPDAVVFVYDPSYGETSTINVSRLRVARGEHVFVASSVFPTAEEVRPSSQNPPAQVDPHAQRLRERTKRQIQLDDTE